MTDIGFVAGGEAGLHWRVLVLKRRVRIAVLLAPMRYCVG